MGEAEVGPHYPSPPAEAPGLRINGLGVRERMSSGLVDRPNGTYDVHIMALHQDSVVDSDGPRPGPLLMIWPHGAPQRYGVEQTDWQHSWLHCEGPELERMLDAEGVVRGVPIIGFAPEPFEYLLRILHRCCTAPAPPEPGVLLGTMQLFARLVGSHLRQHQGPQPPDAFARLRFRLEARPGLVWTIDGMAQACDLSPSHFTRQFRRWFGMPPMEFLIRLRMQRAYHLLADHRRSVASIAEEVGYSDLPYFSRLFHARFGVAPTGCRRLRSRTSQILPPEV